MPPFIAVRLPPEAVRKLRGFSHGSFHGLPSGASLNLIWLSCATLYFNITMDNASNKFKFIDKLVADGVIKNQDSHFRCFAHVLNLCAKACFEPVGKTLENLKTAFKAIRSSHNKMTKFMEYCEATQEDCIVPTFDVETRWNSTYEMLESSFRVQNSMMKIIRELNLDDELGSSKWYCEIKIASNGNCRCVEPRLERPKSRGYVP
jgi:hypothetical protein